MTAPPRLPLSELVTEFILHGDRKHLYVEGREDRAIFEWFLEENSFNEASVFDIDVIEISREELERHDLTKSQRNRVVALAHELDRCLPNDSTQALCIIDADFDYVLNRIEENRFLAYTDGTSLDMYAFTESALDRVIRLGFRDVKVNAGEIMAKLFRVLKDIFLTRATNESLQMGLSWLPFEKRCRIGANGTILFDHERFIRDYLGKNGALARMNEFVQCRQRLAMQDVGIRERCIRGHDLGSLLTQYLRLVVKTKGAKKLATGETVVRMLFVGVDRGEIETKPLFQRILEFLRN